MNRFLASFSAGPLADVGRHFRPFHWREAVLCAPAIPLLLYAGFAADQPLRGAIAAGAAFSVGFGAVRELRGRRWGAMAGATLAMTLAAFVGSLAGQWTWALIALTAVAAGFCARLALFNEELWWVALQATIAFFVAGYYAGPPPEALARAATVCAGGVVQMALVLGLRTLLPQPRIAPAGPMDKPAPDPVLAWTHTLRAALGVALCALAAHALGLANSYWAPMTALLVLKPGLSETQVRGLQRLAGTVGGCLIAGAFATVAAGQLWLMLAAIALTAGLAFALQKASYAVFTMAVTATVVLFLSIGRGAAIATAEHRLEATLLGGVIALVVARVAHRPRPPAPSVADRIGE